MLVLGRKAEQSILIGDDIRITIVDVQGKLVKLGIDAPREKTVLREELTLRIAEANNDASDIENEEIFA